MGVFKRKTSNLSSRSASSSHSRPQLVERLTSSLSQKIRPPPPPLISRVSSSAAQAIGDGVSGRWEKKLIKRSQKFAKDHPIVMQVIGAGLAIMGASAATVPAVLAALGIKIGIGGLSIGAAAIGSTSLFSGAATTAATTGVATSAGGFFATSAKMILGGIAMDVGGRLLEGTDKAPKKKSSIASILSVSGDMTVRDDKLKAL
ncbi:hypothetical protein FRC03_010698 [Tulasnella sp. 419]|nr:hypothetical protein FRC03_010698 [Tulasnella sp. 419]